MEIYLCWYPPSTNAALIPPGKTQRSAEPEDAGKELFVDKEQEAFWKARGDNDRWWGPKATTSGLKKFNPIRLRLVAEAYLKEMLRLDETWEEKLRTDAKSLAGARICDVGCGGGIFTEVLAENGASVVGIDVTKSAIESASRHWTESHSDFDATLKAPEYRCVTVQDYMKEKHEVFDIVVCSEVLEHVTEPQEFAALCCQLVKPGGCIVFSTINRTVFALLWNMIVFEDVLGICPRWLHRLYLCVKPEELRQVTDRLNFKTLKTTGLVWQPLSFNLLNNAGKSNWVDTTFTGCAYAVICRNEA